MSRASRPLRRVRGPDLARLVAALPGYLQRLVVAVPVKAARSYYQGAQLTGWTRVAVLLGCRPAQLRRAALGLPVSARAAARILKGAPCITS